MEASSSWFDLIITIVSALCTIITAIATFFLWRVTRTLANETTRMVEAAAQPQVVATLKPNRYSLNHFDIHIDNTGNATAYDIFIEFDPPLENGEARNEVPLQSISVLKPGQGISSYLTEYKKIEGKVYRVNISWRRDPSNEQRQTNSYTLSMADHKEISYLGNDPLIEISNRIKKIEENWTPIAKGQKKIKVDVFGSDDRLRENRRLSHRLEQELEVQTPQDVQIQQPQQDRHSEN